MFYPVKYLELFDFKALWDINLFYPVKYLELFDFKALWDINFHLCGGVDRKFLLFIREMKSTKNKQSTVKKPIKV